jgi:MFS superfamily sulfate permease-like transporter
VLVLVLAACTTVKMTVGAAVKAAMSVETKSGLHDDIRTSVAVVAVITVGGAIVRAVTVAIAIAITRVVRHITYATSEADGRQNEDKPFHGKCLLHRAH